MTGLVSPHAPALGSAGAGALLRDSDYPHFDGTYPNTQAVVADIFGDVPDAITDAVTRGHAAPLFAVPAPAAP